jgi:hypothetical protein
MVCSRCLAPDRGCGEVGSETRVGEFPTNSSGKLDNLGFSCIIEIVSGSANNTECGGSYSERVKQQQPCNNGARKRSRIRKSHQGSSSHHTKHSINPARLSSHHITQPGSIAVCGRNQSNATLISASIQHRSDTHHTHDLVAF